MSNIPPPQNDVNLLLPSFRAKVLALVAALQARGLDPVVFETRRTAERGIALQRAGKTKNGAQSMHCFDAAADFISASTHWSDPKFFDALGEEAKKLGLTWGGDWDGNPKTPEKFCDNDHVQAIPLSLQNQFRALPTLKRDEFVASYYARSGQ